MFGAMLGGVKGIEAFPTILVKDLKDSQLFQQIGNNFDNILR